MNARLFGRFVINDQNEQYEMCKAENGGISFKVRYPNGAGFATLALVSGEEPNKELYLISFGPVFRVTDNNNNRYFPFTLPTGINQNYNEFVLVWRNGVMQLDMVGYEDPVFTIKVDQATAQKIGFVRFYKHSRRLYMGNRTDWLYESSPLELVSPEILFEDGRLHWVKMTDAILPKDALIGGFEDEFNYIARSRHMGSMCPGKYVHSKQKAFVPWGHREHEKTQFEILCGYNAKWVKTKENQIPENAFIAGTSEVRNGPLYIGRAMLDGKMINGKVHVIYNSCFLPYKGKEIETSEYEILVETHVKTRARFAKPKRIKRACAHQQPMSIRNLHRNLIMRHNQWGNLD